MSADLFAQFGPFSGGSAASNQQGQDRQQASSAQNAADDPFAFLSTAFSQPASQPASQLPPQQPQTQWAASSTAPQPWPAFGAPSQTSELPSSSTTIATQGPPSLATGGDDSDDDTWGDFEEASPGVGVQAPSQPVAVPPQPPLRTRPARAPTMDLLTNTLISLGDGPAAAGPLPSVSEPVSGPPGRQPWKTPRPQPQPKSKKPPSDPNVLFDAEDYDGNESLSEGGDDDEFGDFESGHVSPPRSSTAANRAPPRTAATPAAATALVDLLSLSDPDPPENTGPLPTAVSKAPASKKSHAASMLSPLSFGSTSSGAAELALNYPQPPKSPSFQERNPFPGLAVTTPQSAEFPSEKVRNRTPSPVTTWPSFEPPTSSLPITKDETQPPADDWDAWDIADSGGPPPAHDLNENGKPEPATEAAATSDWDWEAEEPTQIADSNPLPPGIASAEAPKTLPENTPPPTNVPPPSILLSLFPSLIALPDEALFKPIANEPAEVRNRIMGDAKTISFLRNYLQLIVVAARVVAGRKQRWHRDKFLSQSMSISAAGSSKGGGMKLAGLDKAQGQREDREAADVVAAWLRHVGKLRSAVATANAALAAAEATEHKHYPPLKIPDLQSATIPVTTVKNVPTAPRPCVVCGLRRDERVRGVDGDDVQDLFGEWWTEHWGHRVCRNFWAEHEATLRSR